MAFLIKPKYSGFASRTCQSARIKFILSRNGICCCKNKRFSDYNTRRDIIRVLTGSFYWFLLSNPAEAEELVTFLGRATPPASYGGYGGNAQEEPKYSFKYPQSWRNVAINKVQKGTQGIDSKVIDPSNKANVAFVIALGREGEDSKSFRLNDIESTFQGFVAADYELQDAVISANEIIRTKRELNGQQFYDYDIDSTPRYLSTVTVKDGKVFAFFVKCSPRSFIENQKIYHDMILSFKTI